MALLSSTTSVERMGSTTSATSYLGAVKASSNIPTGISTTWSNSYLPMLYRQVFLAMPISSTPRKTRTPTPPVMVTSTVNLQKVLSAEPAPSSFNAGPLALLLYPRPSPTVTMPLRCPPRPPSLGPSLVQHLRISSRRKTFWPARMRIT